MLKRVSIFYKANYFVVAILVNGVVGAPFLENIKF
jgi:hypothetical protein